VHQQSKDIVLAADYHPTFVQFRDFNALTGEEKCYRRETQREILDQVIQERSEAAKAQGGELVFIMESTSGWARMEALVGKRAQFKLANVLQIPLPPKAHRKKTDKIDTGRLMREYLHGDLPEAFKPKAELRAVRRLVGLRIDLVRRQTSVRNWISLCLQHETWRSTENLWSKRGMAALKAWVEKLGEENLDRASLGWRISELGFLGQQTAEVEGQIRKIHAAWKEAQEIDKIKGIGPVGAVSIAARIGPVERFADADALESYAGLVPGVRATSNRTVNLHIGGGGTDTVLRYYLIEASMWARHIERYAPTYQRIKLRYDAKTARIVVARKLLRSIYRMLKDQVPFDEALPPARPRPKKGKTARAKAAAKKKG
jgi:transposase